MARIRVIEADNNEIALAVDDKIFCYWNAPNPTSPFMLELSLVQQMLHEVYEKGRLDQKEEISKTLRGIFGLKE